MNQKEKERVIRALESKGVKLKCPRCSHGSFTVADGYFNQSIQPELSGILLGGQTIPSVVTVCARCGYMAQHALGALGLLDRAKGGEG